MRYLLLLAICFAGSFCHAIPERNEGFDYRAGIGMRTVPIGAAAYGEVGFSEPLWGQWQNLETFNYGFIRPVVRWTSALTINAFDLVLEIHPISFLSLDVGRSYDFRTRDSSASAECSSLQCDGTLRSDFFASNLSLGYGNALLSSEFVLSDMTSSDKAEDFYEEGYAVVGARGHDQFFTQTHFLGFKAHALQLTDLISGISARRTEAHLSGSFSQRASLVLSHSAGDWKITYAAGVHESSLLPAKALALGIQAEWIGSRGLSL